MTSSFLRPLSASAAQGVGKPVARVEDARLVTGRGRFSDDVNLPGQAYAAFVRSPHAHARIRAIDIAAAQKVPGVIAVLTAAEAAADGLQEIPHKPIPMNPHEVPLKSPDDTPFFLTPHPNLAADRVRFVGQAVVMVVAESAAIARDAAVSGEREGGGPGVRERALCRLRSGVSKTSPSPAFFAQGAPKSCPQVGNPAARGTRLTRARLTP